MKEISKTSVAVLLVLTILVSVIGTWSVLESVSNANIQPSQPGGAHSKVSLTVQERPTEQGGQGRISLTVEQPE